jgi:hypothetical protein
MFCYLRGMRPDVQAFMRRGSRCFAVQEMDAVNVQVFTRHDAEYCDIYEIWHQIFESRVMIPGVHALMRHYAGCTDIFDTLYRMSRCSETGHVWPQLMPVGVRTPEMR